MEILLNIKNLKKNMIKNYLFSNTHMKKMISEYPEFSREEELVEITRLSSKFRDEREEARELLILHNLSSTFFIAKKLAQRVSNLSFRRTLDLSEDFFQEGILGLYNATYGFRKEKNVRFSTYARTCIKNKIKDCYRDYLSAVSPAYNVFSPHTLSLNTPLTGKDNEDTNHTVESLLVDHQNPDEKIVELERNELIDEVLKKLPPDLEPVIRMRFGIGVLSSSNSGYKGRASNQREIGRVLGVSKQCIEQRESKALNKLKYRLDSLDL
jgi:RNA polymerase sigma factor (sigma-70 family)